MTAVGFGCAPARPSADPQGSAGQEGPLSRAQSYNRPDLAHLALQQERETAIPLMFRPGSRLGYSG